MGIRPQFYWFGLGRVIVSMIVANFGSFKILLSLPQAVQCLKAKLSFPLLVWSRLHPNDSLMTCRFKEVTLNLYPIGLQRWRWLMVKKDVALAERSKTPDWEQRSKIVDSIPGPPCQQFFNPGLQKKINQAPSVRVKVIRSDHKNFYGGILVKMLILH